MFLVQSPFTGDQDKHERVEKLLRGYTSPGTELDLCYPDDFAGSRVFQRMGEQSVLTGLHHALETPALVRKTVWAQDHGYDAVVQSNTFDPGVEAGRLAVGIPVIGLFRTSLHVAATLSTRVGVMVPLDGHVPYVWRLLNGYGMDRFVTSVRPIQVYGQDLISRREEIEALAVAVMKEQVERDGAEIIIPLGGALIPYVVSPESLSEHVGVPVLNTKSIGIRFAETCVALGISQSEAAYPRADLSIDDFDGYSATR